MPGGVRTASRKTQADIYHLVIYCVKYQNRSFPKLTPNSTPGAPSNLRAAVWCVGAHLP